MTMDHLTVLVRSMSEQFFLSGEVAKVMGYTSARQLRKLTARHPELGPSYRMNYEERVVGLYTPADVRRIEAFRRAGGVAGRGKDLASST